MRTIATTWIGTTSLIAAMAAIGFGNVFAEPPMLAPVQVAGETTPRTLPVHGSKAAQPQRALPAALPGQALEIVVKFKDDAKVRDIIEAFWKNPPDAKARFEAFKKGRPELADLELDRVTYSNELVLVHRGRDGFSGELTATRAIVARLSATPDIAYAEVDATAHIGGQ